ncbi:hypothetical protein [Candidatus Leptofilum sp.]|uniref:hypothetical protein n=1 Tax=Candidatus Leptofilum sp. TaxID=3241576 RepID=UPI003B5A6A0C
METPNNINEISKIQKDLCWGLYQDVRSHSRHAETLRSSAVNYMLVVASALITVITFDDHINRFDLPLSIIVTVIGLISAFFSASYTELYYRNRERAGHIRKHLDKTYFKDQAPTSLSQILEEADADHHDTKIYRWSRRITGSTHLFWLVPPLMVLTIGIVLTVLSLQ